MWSIESLARAAADGLQARNEHLDAEQAVYGLDAASEVELHAWVREGFAAAGYGVWPEIPFPGEPMLRPKRSERERCDVVLTPEPTFIPSDPVADLLDADAAAATLFAGAHRLPDPRITPVEDAFWLEIKVVHQYAYVNGIPGPNTTYASELTRGPCRDITKLAADGRIFHAGLLLVHFTADEATADHDLRILTGRLLDRDLPVAAPLVEHVPIADRIGNRLCSTAVFRVRPRNDG